MDSGKPAADRETMAGVPRHLAPGRAAVAAALTQLPVEQRDLLRRAYYDGWSTQQIAADLEMAEVSVKTQLHYALRALQQGLQSVRTLP